MNENDPYKDFTGRLKLLIDRHPDLITTTLSNIFTMRLIGNKTHGDLAEIAISEFINQYMYDFRSTHVGKDLYRAKSQEEDISITNEVTKKKFPVSLKAYGDGPLQLSTDKKSRMFPRLELEGMEVQGQAAVQRILEAPEFTEFRNINVLPMIYDEGNQRCNILVFDCERAMNDTVRIVKEEREKGRKHPVYRFYNARGDYVCEVRYGNATANALQRGLWTHTRNGSTYFESITGGWINYSHNRTLIALFSHALISSETGHALALATIEDDIAQMRRASGLLR